MALARRTGIQGNEKKRWRTIGERIIEARRINVRAAPAVCPTRVEAAFAA